MSKVTLKEIAQKTGVSLGTVHRAIYGKSGIGEETRKRVLEEVERSNYQVDEAASILKRKAKKIIVVLPKPEGDERFYLKGIWSGIKEAAATMAQYKLKFEYIETSYSLSEMWRELEQVYDELLDEMDGLITIADGEQANIWINRFARRGVYTVLLSSYYVGDNDMVCCIKSDHERCGRLAAEFLNYAISPKDGKVLFLCGNREVYSNGTYANRFEKEMKKNGFSLIPVEGFGRKEIEKELLEHLQKDNISGIFSLNARNTYSLCKILDEHHIGGQYLTLGTDLFEEIRCFFENGTLNAVICQFQWDQGKHAVQKMHAYLSQTLGQIPDEQMPPVLLMNSNYDCFLTE